MRTSEILETAADKIEGRWTQGSGWYDHDNDDEGLCLEGGLYAAMGIEFNDDNDFNNGRSQFLRCPAYRAVVQYLKENVASECTPSWAVHSLFVWNDYHANSEQQVLDVLRGAAKVERAKEETTTN